MFLPKAIVFSGLEQSTSAQRALLEVLAEQRVLLEDGLDGLYTLPEDFMVVYVCPVDLWERPKIHTSLVNVLNPCLPTSLMSYLFELVGQICGQCQCVT
jgi:hypothetical protein